jgi:aminopeptidase N
MNRMLPRLLLAGSTAALIAAAPAHKLPGKGEPPITALTQRSGGPIDPDQAIEQFDHADLRFVVKPANEEIDGIATLTFTARAPMSKLVVDLDRNLGPQAVAIDGKPLPRSAWDNPEGRLTIALPRPVAAGGKVVARIT